MVVRTGALEAVLVVCEEDVVGATGVAAEATLAKGLSCGLGAKRVVAVVGRCAGLLTLEQTGCLLQEVLGLENRSRHAGDGQSGTDKVANGNHCAGDCLTKTNEFWNSEMRVAAGLIVGKERAS